MHHLMVARKFSIVLSVIFALIHYGVCTQELTHKIEYSINDLGTPSKRNKVFPDQIDSSTITTGVNNSGQVVGNYSDSSEAFALPFVWQNAKLFMLPTLGGPYGRAIAINSHGDIAGFADTAYKGRWPVIWRRDNKFTPFALADRQSDVNCLLDDGTSAGTLYDKNGKWRAAKWKDGAIQILGNSNDTESTCTSINSNGIAVGYYIPKNALHVNTFSHGDRHAVMWKNGEQILMPELGGRQSMGTAINEVGIVVGWLSYEKHIRACIWKDGKVEILPSSEVSESYAYSINRSGTIVGQGIAPVGQSGKLGGACRWRDGKIVSLQYLIPADSGWTLEWASHISDSGFIVGVGHNNKYPKNERRGFLLTPVNQKPPVQK